MRTIIIHKTISLCYTFLQPSRAEHKTEYSSTYSLKMFKTIVASRKWCDMIHVTGNVWIFFHLQNLSCFTFRNSFRDCFEWDTEPRFSWNKESCCKQKIVEQHAHASKIFLFSSKVHFKISINFSQSDLFTVYITKYKANVNSKIQSIPSFEVRWRWCRGDASIIKVIWRSLRLCNRKKEKKFCS